MRYTYVYLTTFVRALQQLGELSQYSDCAIGCMTEGSGFDTTEKRKYYFHHRIKTGTLTHPNSYSLVSTYVYTYFHLYWLMPMQIGYDCESR